MARSLKNPPCAIIVGVHVPGFKTLGHLKWLVMVPVAVALLWTGRVDANAISCATKAQEAILDKIDAANHCVVATDCAEVFPGCVHHLVNNTRVKDIRRNVPKGSVPCATNSKHRAGYMHCPDSRYHFSSPRPHKRVVRCFKKQCRYISPRASERF